jgi:hypothetical protein
MENFSSFKRVVGAKSEDQERAILEGRSKVFSDQDFPELNRIEREKTPDEIAIIGMVNEATNKLLEKYGVARFNLPADNIHVVPEREWRDGLGSAFYVAVSQVVVTREEPARIVFLKKVFHEMLHFKSYNAIQVIDEEQQREDQYRVGVTVMTRDGKSQYFKYLNEAITEELTKQCVTELFQNELFTEENIRTAEIIEMYPDARTADGSVLFDDEVFYVNIEEVSGWNEALGRLFGFARRKRIMAESFAYQEERKFLTMLVETLYQMNPGEFADKQEVFDLFAQAALTGNLLTIGKLVDRTLGLGTFRKIGEMGTNLDIQREMFDLVQTDLWPL